MKRPFKKILSKNAFSHIRYLPAIIQKIKNWPTFLFAYLGIINKYKNNIVFRNGLKLKTFQKFDTATIAVVFIKEDYGKIHDNAVVVDIGANIGAFSLYAASSAKNVSVYAFEPMPENFKSLQENIRNNIHKNNIEIFQSGVAGTNNKRKLFLNDSPFHTLYATDTDNNEYLEIECLTLDDIFKNNSLDKIDILKLDCEGAEFEILYQTPKDYIARINEIRMEYHNQDDKTFNIKALTSYLAGHHFKPTFKRADANKSTGNIWFNRDRSR